MSPFKHIGLIVTEKTEETATAQIAVVVNHRRIDAATVEANFSTSPSVVERGGSLEEAVARLLERALPGAWVERSGDGAGAGCACAAYECCPRCCAGDHAAHVAAFTGAGEGQRK